jgi:hypothetical protein
MHPSPPRRAPNRHFTISHAEDMRISIYGRIDGHFLCTQNTSDGKVEGRNEHARFWKSPPASLHLGYFQTCTSTATLYDMSVFNRGPHVRSRWVDTLSTANLMRHGVVQEVLHVVKMLPPRLHLLGGSQIRSGNR